MTNSNTMANEVIGMFNNQPDVDMKIVTITPDVAQRLLDTSNYDNRFLRKAHVASLAARIKNGEWKLTPQGIIIHSSGRLLDGQHRLAAIVQADIPVTTTMFTVEDDSIFTALDQGAKRSMADLTNTDGRVMDTVNFCTRLMLNRFSSLSFGLVEPVLKSSVGELSQELIDFCPTSRKGMSSSPVKSACVSAVIFGSPKEYAFGLYRDLVMTNVRNLPPIGEAFLRQLNTGSVDFSKANGGKNTYARSVKLFTFKNRKQQVIRMSKDALQPMINESSKKLKRHLQMEGSLDLDWGRS